MELLQKSAIQKPLQNQDATKQINVKGMRATLSLTVLNILQ